MVDPIENAANVSIEHPVHALAHQRHVHCGENHIRAPPRPKAVGEAEEVALRSSATAPSTISSSETGTPRGRCPPSSFRDVDTSNRLWPVTARVDARAEIPEISL